MTPHNKHTAHEHTHRWLLNKLWRLPHCDTYRLSFPIFSCYLTLLHMKRPPRPAISPPKPLVHMQQWMRHKQRKIRRTGRWHQGHFVFLNRMTSPGIIVRVPRNWDQFVHHWLEGLSLNHGFFFTWLSNSSIYPIYMIDQWQFNTYIVTAIYNVSHSEIRHLFLGDWLQLTALLLRVAKLPAIFQTENVLVQAFSFCLMIQFFLLNS